MQQNEMDIIIGEKIVQVSGEDITIKKFSFKQGQLVAINIAKLVKTLLNYTEEVAFGVNLIKENSNPIEAITGLSCILASLEPKDVDNFNEIIRIGAKLSKEQMEELDLEEGIELVIAMYEVNKSFFTRFMNNHFPQLEKQETKAKTKKK